SLRQRLRGALAGEDGDGIDDGVERVSRYRVAEVSLGIGEGESFECIVEQLSSSWSGPGCSGLPCALLLSQPRLKLLPRVLSLLGGNRFLVEFYSASSSAVSTRATIDGTSEGGCDEKSNLP